MVGIRKSKGFKAIQRSKKRTQQAACRNNHKGKKVYGESREAVKAGVKNPDFCTSCQGWF